MTDSQWKPGPAANRDRRIRLMRIAQTNANYRHGMGGLPKENGHKPKPITLPKMPWDETKPDKDKD